MPRPKGSRNVRTLELQKRLKDQDPLEMLLQFAADENEDKRFRYECAKAALPYVYPRLASLAVEGEVNVNAVEASTEELYRRVIEGKSERMSHGPSSTVN